MKFYLPESTADYLYDTVVHNAVASILAVSEDAMPESLNSDELANYYRARAAAVAVKYDTVIALEQLWHAVWGDMLIQWNCDEGHISELSPETIWSDVDFSMHYERAGFDFYAGLEILRATDDLDVRVRLVCSLEDPAGTECLDEQLISFAVAGKREAWTDWMVMKEPISFPERAVWDLISLNRLRKKALALMWHC